MRFLKSGEQSFIRDKISCSQLVQSTGHVIVSFAAVISVVTQCSSPVGSSVSGEERCVMTLITAARETRHVTMSFQFLTWHTDTPFPCVQNVFRAAKKCFSYPETI